MMRNVTCIKTTTKGHLLKPLGGDGGSKWGRELDDARTLALDTRLFFGKLLI